MKIALVHDQLQEFGGAERVLVALHKIFPEAPIYTAFYNQDSLEKHVPDYENWDIHTSWAQNIPFFKSLYSPLRFLAPAIWESFDFSDYDVVISSSGWYMCKGIKTRSTDSGPSATHICYLHHPPRYLYGYETAVEWQKYWPVRIYAAIVNHFLRQWDYTTSQRPDYFIANSEETKRRIQKFYRRDATVIYPPVDIPKDSNVKTQMSNPYLKSENYFITVSRLARAKHIDLLVETANKYKLHLKVVGSGRDFERLQSIAGDTVEFLTNVSDTELGTLLQNAKAFLFASRDEEFGIAPIEAMGYGTPVIAFNSGGLKETVKPGVNGFLFDALSTNSVYKGIKKLESLSKEKYLEMRKNARVESEKYSFDRFKKEILTFLARVISTA